MSDHTTPQPDSPDQPTDPSQVSAPQGEAPASVDTPADAPVEATPDEGDTPDAATSEEAAATSEDDVEAAPTAESVEPVKSVEPVESDVVESVEAAEGAEAADEPVLVGETEPLSEPVAQDAQIEAAEPAAAEDAPAQAAEDAPAQAAEDAPAQPAAAGGEPAPEPPATPKPQAPATPAPPPSAPTLPQPDSLPGAATGAEALSAASSESAKFGRVADDGTVYVRTPEGEREVGSYPGAPAQEALAYFVRKFDELNSLADLLYARVTQTDLSAKDGAESLAKLREATTDLHAVGDLVALAAKVENIATALEARRVVEAEQRAAARAEALTAREAIVAEAERIAATPEPKVQWKSSSARMRALLDEWKAAQRGGPKLDRETEQALWHRLSSSRNSFDKMRRVHFAQLGSSQAQAKAAKLELVEEAEKLASSTEWGATAGAYKRLMDRWRQAGRASRTDDDALWKRFKAAQDAFFGAKDSVVAAENEEFTANLAVKEELLVQAQALLPVRDLEATKAALRALQDKWDAAGKVPRSAMERIEKGMRRVEAAVREADDKRWKATNPEVAARAASMASQAEAALERYRKDLAKAEASGDQRRITKAREALEAREQWLKQARAGLAEFGG